ncbi:MULTISPECIES: hypothetical protein [Gammaproteobacteria]|uniref:hypothetical protein n=1 Tax=Acinetobacter sp. HRXRD-152 TaxID=3404808 RepID=UPI003BB6C475
MARKQRELNNNPFEETPKQQTPKVVEPGEGSTPTDEAPTTNTDTLVKDVTNDLMEEYSKKKSKPTIEDTHKRVTFLLDRELNDRLNRLAEGKNGFKTMFLNRAVKALLDELE